ncbi:hypothetical protein Tco_0650504 [Tanacetum coccineum]
MSSSNQQTLAKSGATDRPPILEKENYIPWESRFRRFLENKWEDGERMWYSITKGPYERPMITDPNSQIPKPMSKKTKANKKRYIANVKERIRRLMYGLEKNKHVIHSRIMNEFDKFDAKEGESLDSVYERLSTLVNVMNRNDVHPIKVSINIKFLNSLQPEWSKYVTLTRQNKDLSYVEYDSLYHTLLQFEPHVQASKAKRATKNHGPLALISPSNSYLSQSHASPSYCHSPQPYYVTHPSLVVDFEEDYQRDLQGDAQEDKLTTTMMNQAVIHDGRVGILTKNVGYGRNGKRNAGRQNKNQAVNAGNGQRPVAVVVRDFYKKFYNSLGDCGQWSRKGVEVLLIVPYGKLVLSQAEDLGVGRLVG